MNAGLARRPVPAPLVAGVPASTPFVAPEALARSAGHASLLRLGANESAFGPSPRALVAMRDDLERISWYADPESHALRAALAARHGCAPEEVVAGSGIDDLLGLAVRAYCGAGGTAVATLGTYPTFAYHVLGYGGRLETVPGRDDGSIDADALIAAAHRSRAAIVYLANPDNPSGTFAAAPTVERICNEVPPATLVILDEAYADFVAGEDLPAEAVLPGTIRMRTFSKAFGLAGARIAYGIAAREVIETFQKIRLHFGVNRTAQAGAFAALDDPQHVERVVAQVAEGRRDYYALAAEHGLASIPSHTNFVCIDIGSRSRAEAMVRTLLELGVFVRKPAAPPIDRFIRITVGTKAERAALRPLFAEALARIGEKTPA